MSAAELFKVTCVTCQARLSVRNQELIGQIIACPRCESMVQVAPPPPATSPVVVAPVAEALTPSKVPEIPPQDPIETPPVEEQVVEVSSTAISTAEAGLSGAGGPSMLVLSLGSFLVGAVITGGVLYLRSWGSTDEAKGHPQVGEQLKPSTQAPAVPQTAVPSNTAASAATEEISEPTTPTLPAESSSGDPEDSNPFAAAVDPTPTNDRPTQEDGVGSVESDDATENEEAKLVIETPEPVRIARKFDPLRFDPEQLDLSSVSRESDRMERENGTNPQSDFHPNEGDVSEVAGGTPTMRVSANSLGRDMNYSAAERLSRTVPSLQIEKMPLSGFFDLVSQLSGIPVSCDPSELQMAGISSSKPVSCSAEDLTIEAVLAQVLDPLKLDALPQGRQIVVVRKAGDKVRENSYPAEDLLGGATSLGSFVNWIPLLVAPTTWEGAGGSGTIEVRDGKLLIRQTQRVHYQVLFFLERIRQARGIPLLSRYPTRLLSKTPEMTPFRQRLQVPATFTFSLETPLQEVFRQWETELGLAIAADWPRLEQANLWPATPVVAAVAGRPWSEALRDTLSPLGLGWRAHAGTLEITTQEVVEHDFLLDLYPVKGGEAERLRDLAAQLSPDVLCVEDTANGLLYVLAPGSVHKRLSE